MAPPPLPESTLVIAPNKAGTKKKRRPAFRPGQRTAKVAPSKKTASKDENKQVASSTSIAEESENEKRIPQEESVEKEVDRNDSQEIKDPPSIETAEKAGVDHLAKKSIEKPAEPESVVDGEQTSKTPTEKPPVPKPVPIAAKTAKAPAEVKTKATSIRTKAASSIREKVASPVRAKATSSPVKAKPATSIKAKVSSTKQKQQSATEKTTTASTRKRKSTGLVIGSSRVSARKKNKKQLLEEESTADNDTAVEVEPNSNEVVATGPRAPPLLPANLPPPKEGEVALTTYCSKFRSKPRHPQPPKKKQKQTNKNKEKEKEPEPEEAAVPVVQIINGEIVLQESSMVVEERGGSSMRRAGDEEEEYTTVVEEVADLTIVNADYTSFTNRTKPSLWTHDETKLFYEALRQVGTDFMLMAEFFKNRNRKQLKRKYQKELVSNPDLIDKALHPDQQKPLDMTVFDITDAQVQEQKEAAKKKEIEEKEAKAKAEAEAKSKKEENGNNTNDGGVEVVIEDDDEEEDIFGGGCRKVSAGSEEKSAFELLMEATLPPEQSLWPSSDNSRPAEDEVVEEDPMMLEEYQQYENFDELPAHDDERKETEKRTEAAKDQPSLSLLPSAGKKKKKQKFKTARPGRKKK